MSNVLKMDQQIAITSLLRKGWSQRKISRELGVDRETVRRYHRLVCSKPAIPPTGLEAPGIPKPAISPPGSVGRKSRCTDYHDLILDKFESGLSGVRIWQDLQYEHGLSISYDSIKRYLRKFPKKDQTVYRRLESVPGEQIQVDFGSGWWVRENGKRRKTHFFRAILSHSRKAYSELVYRQTTENLLRCLENAFHHFGGCTETVVLDNMKAAIKTPDWYDPELNPKLIAFSHYYQVTFLPIKPYTPRHNGKVESGVGYLKKNALKGKQFKDLSSGNQYLRDWEARIADTRIHGTTKKQVQSYFEKAEKDYLKSIPFERFPLYQEGKRKVHSDAHIEVSRSYYSVPGEYVGHYVWVCWNDHIIRTYNQNFEQIALHLKVKPGQFKTDPKHLSQKRIAGVERGAEYFLNRIRCIGEKSLLWAKGVIDNRGVQSLRVLQGFIALASKHAVRDIEEACGLAESKSIFSLKPLRKIVQHYQENASFEFLEKHPIIRPIEDYQYVMINVNDTPVNERSNNECTIENVLEETQTIGSVVDFGDPFTGS